MDFAEIFDKYHGVYQIVSQEYPQYTRNQIIAFLLTAILGSKDKANTPDDEIIQIFRIYVLYYEDNDPVIRYFVNQMITVSKNLDKIN